MTDFEVVLDLLARADVAPVKIEDGYEPAGPTSATHGRMRPDWVMVSTEGAPPDAKIGGYGGFFADWVFDAQGALVFMGVWE